MFAGLFFLLFLLILVVLTILILVFGPKKRGGISFYLILFIWGIPFLFFLFSYLGKPLWSKKVLDKDDFYGEYIIDRNYFSGVQSDWQYNHYRFEIKNNDSIYFHETNGAEIVKTYKGMISTVSPYKSTRFKINMVQPRHHVLSSNPNIYREVWDFFLVFESPKFYNMYFRKGKWKELKSNKK